VIVLIGVFFSIPFTLWCTFVKPISPFFLWESFFYKYILHDYQKQEDDKSIAQKKKKKESKKND